MAKQRLVKIERVIEGQHLVGSVLEETVPAWTQNGWTVVDDEGSETDPLAGADDHQEEQPRRAVFSKNKEK